MPKIPDSLVQSEIVRMVRFGFVQPEYSGPPLQVVYLNLFDQSILTNPGLL